MGIHPVICKYLFSYAMEIELCLKVCHRADLCGFVLVTHLAFACAWPAIPVVRTIEPPLRICGLPYLTAASAAQYRNSNARLACLRSVAARSCKCRLSPAVKTR